MSKNTCYKAPQKYIGVKIVQATMMRAEDASLLLGRPINTENAKQNPMSVPEEYKDAHDGYLVTYPDGYQSWCPKEQFEKANLLVDGNKVTQQMVDDFVVNVDAQTIGPKTTLVQATLANGFVLTESSACIDPANYDAVVGAEICLGKIKDKVWFLLGFLLQSGISGFRSVE